MGGVQGVRVVSPTQAPRPGQQVFIQVAGSSVATQILKRGGEVVRYRQSVTVVTAQTFTPLLVQLLSEVMTAPGISPRLLIPVPPASQSPQAGVSGSSRSAASGRASGAPTRAR